MLKSLAYAGIQWIDLESPTEEEVRRVREQFDIDPFICRELTSPSNRSRVDTFPTYFFLALHFPRVGKRGRKRRGNGTEEVDFIIGRDFLVTAHYAQIPIIHRFAKQAEMEKLLGHPSNGTASGGHLFFAFMEKLYEHLSDDLDRINERVGDVEERVYEGEEEEMVPVISELSRDAIDFQRAFAGHEQLLRALERRAGAIIGNSFEHYTRSLTSDYERISTHLVNLREIIRSLRETNDSLLSSKNATTMKHLTMMAFVTFPLSLLSNIFSMNAIGIPIIGHPLDFWIIISMMSFVAVSMFLFFRYMKWL